MTGQFFPLLRTPALVGRTLTPEDDQPGAEPAVVLSYGFWQSRICPGGVAMPNSLGLWRPVGIEHRLGRFLGAARLRDRRAEHVVDMVDENKLCLRPRVVRKVV